MFRFGRGVALGAAGLCFCGAAIAGGNAQRWWAHVAFLASDRLEGRETGSTAYREAARYVAATLRKAGVVPAGIDGYFQPVGFEVRKLREADSTASLVRGTNIEPLVAGRDFMFRSTADSAPEVEAPLVFVGYGLSIPEAGEEDTRDLDLKGKIAVYLSGAPSSIPGPLAAHAQAEKQRWGALSRAGAIGAIRIMNPLHLERSWESMAASRGMSSMSLREPALNDSAGEKISVMVNPASAEKLFAGSPATFAEVVAAAKAQRPLPRLPLVAALRARLRFDRRTAESDNVVGVVRGTDPALRGEYVVLTAHLDHLGIGSPVGGDRIYNGAMDNASGVATLLDTAQELHDRGIRLKRSVAFLAVTGEEKGLLGSKYFAAHPTLPAGSIVADINVDMFLPISPLRLLTVEGLEESDLGPRLAAVAKESGVAVQPDPHPERNYFIRSDQYNFILRGIPAIDFEVGAVPGSPEDAAEEKWIREHYHSPSDDVSQPVDLGCAAAYNRIVLGLVRQVADDPVRPSWNATSFFRRFAAGKEAR